MKRQLSILFELSAKSHFPKIQASCLHFNGLLRSFSYSPFSIYSLFISLFFLLSHCSIFLSILIWIWLLIISYYLSILSSVSFYHRRIIHCAILSVLTTNFTMHFLASSPWFCRHKIQFFFSVLNLFGSQFLIPFLLIISYPLFIHSLWLAFFRMKHFHVILIQITHLNISNYLYF